MGEPYGLAPWQVMETWTLEQIDMMLDCMEDRAAALERETGGGRGGPETLTEEQFIAQLGG